LESQKILDVFGNKENQRKSANGTWAIRWRLTSITRLNAWFVNLVSVYKLYTRKRSIGTTNQIKY